MIQDIEMLNHLHENADMGSSSLRQLMNLSDDAEFIKSLSEQLSDYEKLYETTGEMLKSYHAEPADARPMSKAMSYISANMKSLTDHSPSRLSEMVIQGSTMGITNLTKQLNQYNGHDKAIVGLVKEQIKTEQNNIEQMKKFL